MLPWQYTKGTRFLLNKNWHGKSEMLNCVSSENLTSKVKTILLCDTKIKNNVS
jgi:hypothetical protein